MKRLSLFLSAACVVYTLIYMRYAAPWTNAGALSTIGLRHRAEFTVWGLLTIAALSVSVYTAYSQKVKTKVYLPLLAVSALGMAMTLIFRFDYDIKPDYYYHCAGSLMFSISMGINVFLLFLLSKRKALCTVTALILISDIIFLIIFKETGLIEAVPIFAGIIMLNIYIFRGEKIEAARKT